MTATFAIQYLFWIIAALLLWSLIGSGRTPSSGASRLFAYSLFLGFFATLFTQIGGGWDVFAGLLGQSVPFDRPESASSGVSSLLPYRSIVQILLSATWILILIHFVRHNPQALVLYLLVTGGMGLLLRVVWLEPVNRRMSQLSDAERAALDARAAVREYFYETGVPPLNRTQAGLPSDPSYPQNANVCAVDIVQGAIVVSFSRQAVRPLAGKSLTWTPYERDRWRGTNDHSMPAYWEDRRRRFEVFWRCGNGAVHESYALLGTAAGVPAIRLHTTIADDYLPHVCRQVYP